MTCSVEKLPETMSLHLLKEITNDFSEELGGGKYGTVHKGVQNGVEIAVKMLRFTPGIDDRKQFEREFENLKRLSHRNIVQLLGYCYKIKREYVDYGNERFVFADCIYRALSFEYMHNGNLREYISGEFDGLDWKARYKIIKGMCEGLRYLHEEMPSPIYHLDLKPENILLDKNMMPKLADFGLSRLVVNEQTRATESPVGTIGYLPPEYIEDNLISPKFDIFSLGIVMIKIMAGHEGYHKKAEMSPQEFIDLVHENWSIRLRKERGCTSQEDACNQVKRCIEIASHCVRTDRKQRPEIGTIIHWLNETEHVSQNMAFCLPHESRKEQRRHIEKVEEVQPVRVTEGMDTSTRSQLQELALQPGGEDEGQPKEDAGGKRHEDDGSCSSVGGEGGGENTDMVLSQPTRQQIQLLKQQRELKGLKLPPNLECTLPEDNGSESDDDLDNDDLDDQDYSEDEASELDDDIYHDRRITMAPSGADGGGNVMRNKVGVLPQPQMSPSIPGVGPIYPMMPFLGEQVMMRWPPNIRSPGIPTAVGHRHTDDMPPQQSRMAWPTSNIFYHIA